MKARHLPAISFAALLLAGLPATAGTFTTSTFSSDVTSGISTNLDYTARADFNGDGTRVVNGVPFTDTSATGGNYSLSGPGTPFGGDANNVSGSAGAMMSDFLYGSGGDGLASLTLTGSTVGERYVTSWYNTAFGPLGGRIVAINASDTNTTFNFDQNYSGNNNGNVLRYAFTAAAPTITYTFDAAADNDTFHHYAFTNAATTLSTPVITEMSGPGPAMRLSMCDRTTSFRQAWRSRLRVAISGPKWPAVFPR